MKILYVLSFLFISILMIEAQPATPQTGLYTWSELKIKPGDHRVGRQLMEGSTPLFDYFEIHATTQDKGAKSRPPHAQNEIEEFILIKEGTMRFTMDGAESILTAGSVIFIPPHAMQALENIGDGPLTYYVLMYKGKSPMDMNRNKAAGDIRFYVIKTLPVLKNAKGERVSYFDKATAHCSRAEFHTTVLHQKGPSHDAHTHVDMEMILVLQGKVTATIEGHDYTGVENDLIYIESNQSHQVKNAGDLPCKYFAIRLNTK